LPTHPAGKAFAVSKIRFCKFHGMEEVVSSILTRSTKYLNNLDGAGSFRRGEGSNHSSQVFALPFRPAALRGNNFSVT
jgi:hypothetical protein